MSSETETYFFWIGQTLILLVLSTLGWFLRKEYQRLSGCSAQIGKLQLSLRDLQGQLNLLMHRLQVAERDVEKLELREVVNEGKQGK